MIPYTSFLYFGILLYAAVPTLALRALPILSGIRRLRLSQFWLLLLTAIMLVVQYTPPELRLVIGYVLLEWLVARVFLAARQRGKNRIVYLAVMGLALLPLVLVRVTPLVSSNPDSLIGFLGISYMTFRVIDVVINIQDGLIAQLPAVDYAAFLLFFPTISAGPIDRYRRFKQDWQHERNRAEFMSDLDGAINRMFRGFLYKFILAALIKQFWLDPAALASGGNALVSYMYAYSFYLFFDFAGYSAFAIGISYILGFHPPENFNRPFLSRTIREFWDRWHISLSWWFRDHVYSRFVVSAMKGKWLKGKQTISYSAFYVSMGLMGLWHGLTWYYILYGLYHATLLVGYDLFERWNKARGGIGKRWVRLPTIASTVVTFNLVCFGLLLFSGRLDARFAAVAKPVSGPLDFALSIGCSSSEQTLNAVSRIQTNGALAFSQGDELTIASVSAFNVTINGGVPLSTAGTFTYRVPNSGAYRFVVSSTSENSSLFNIRCISTILGSNPMPFTDGRCNQVLDEPVAVFPDGFGGYNFYATSLGSGLLALHVGDMQLTANGRASAGYLIAENLGVSLLRLTDGTLQVQRLKPDGAMYAFNWTSCGWQAN